MQDDLSSDAASLLPTERRCPLGQRLHVADGRLQFPCIYAASELSEPCALSLDYEKGNPNVSPPSGLRPMSVAEPADRLRIEPPLPD